MQHVQIVQFDPTQRFSIGQVQWSVETSKNIIDSVKTGVHKKMQETLMSIKGTYVGDTQKLVPSGN